MACGLKFVPASGSLPGFPRLLLGISLASSLLVLTACGGDNEAAANTPPPALACAPTTGPLLGPAAALNQVLTNARAANGFNAILFSATQQGQPLLTTAVGVSTPGVPATTDMHFRVGMPAEQFETLLMLKLVEDGSLDLAAPVSKWFPTFPHADLATVRMLAASSSGFGDYAYGPADPAQGIQSFGDLLYADVHRTFTTAELIARSQPPYQVPQFANPGGDWAYSHSNYVVLGSILESAGGSDYATLLQNKVLTPLNLSQTSYTTSAGIPAPFLHAYTSERGSYEESTDWSPSWTSYSGSLTSNVCDLATWARAFGTGALLKPETAAQITATTNVGLGPNTLSRYFGLGVIISNGWLVGEGNYFGWHTSTAYYPPKQIAFTFTTTEGPTTTNGNSTSRPLLRQLSQILAPDSPIDLP
jgi:CubicO group peptidase (beta-lactamase class C family)